MTSATQTSLWRSSVVKKNRPAPTSKSGRIDGRSSLVKRTRRVGRPPSIGTDQIDEVSAQKRSGALSKRSARKEKGRAHAPAFFRDMLEKQGVESDDVERGRSAAENQHGRQRIS